MISNILSNYTLFMEQMWAKNSKNVKNVVRFFFFAEGNKKTEKCASGDVVRGSYVAAKKKTILL